jgi:DNA-binding XRE family transcriptional regulator
MKKINKLPRILKIVSVDGFKITCIFNNGETRLIDFERLFSKWKPKSREPAYKLQRKSFFKKVTLQNQTLCWQNLKVPLHGLGGKTEWHAYEIDPITLYENSEPATMACRSFYFGDTIRKERIKKGLTQQELADLSGTSKTYISRIENNELEPGLSTLYKLVEIALGKKISIVIK